MKINSTRLILVIARGTLSGVAVLAAAVMLAFTVGQPLQAQTPSLTTDWSSYRPREPIVVTFKNTPGKPRDWVGIYPEGVVPGPTPSTLWYYVDGTQVGTIGKTEGVLTFAGGLNTPGIWFARFLLNDGYAELTNTMFQVIEPGAPMVRPSKRAFSSGEDIQVTFTNGPGNPKDWVGIYRAGQAPASATPLSRLYVDGTTNGVISKTDGILDFGGQLTTVGDYVVYFLLNNGNEVLASEVFSVTLAPVTNEVAVIPASWAVPSNLVDKTKPGFRIRPYGTQADNPNSLAWTEDQLAGLHGTNTANLQNADAEGYLVHEGIINFAREADGQVGNFTEETGYPESPLPGFPGTQSRDNGTGNATEEILTFLEFPAPGDYTMGVFSDDGFKVTTGRNVQDRFAMVLGQTEGAGQNIPFRFRVEQAGLYPFRLIWQNGGGGAYLEWYTQDASGARVPVNDTVPGAIKAYRVGPAGGAFVSKISPGINQPSVPADAEVMVELTDGSDQIDPASIKLQLTGSVEVPIVSKTGNVTQVILPSTHLLPSGSNSQATLTYGTSSGILVTNTWDFTIAQYVTLPTNSATPLGSGVASQSGFRVRTYQIESGLQPSTSFAEQQLAGLFGQNIADLSAAGADGFFVVPGTINWNKDAEDDNNDTGHFQAPRHPDAPIPGAIDPYDNLAAEILTYVEFPKAGYYTMGISCDDGFRIIPAEAPGARIGALDVISPTSIAGRYGAVSSGQENSGIALPLPADTPLAGPLIYANPPDASSELSNSAQIRGNLALIDRGEPSFSEQINRAERAGAIGVVIVNNDDAPFVMIGQLVNLPAVMISSSVGDLIKAQLTNRVTVSLGEDPSLRLGEHNYINFTPGPDTFLFGVVAPAPGVYPLRCAWYARGGGNRANLEWFTSPASGHYILLNDLSNTNALKAYRERSAPPLAPILSMTRTTNGLSISYTGVLQSAAQAEGPYNDMTEAPNPLAVAPDMAARFYRARQ